MWNSLSIAISMAVMSAVRELLRLLSQQPTDQNITNQELAQHYQRVRRAEAQARESWRREEEARMREREAIQRKQVAMQREAEARRHEKEATLAADSRAKIAARQASQREEEAKKLEEEAKRLAGEIKRMTLDAQKHEDEAKVREEGMRREKEAVSKAQEQEQQAKNDLERALSKGIQPEVWPTEAQFQSAKIRIQYDPDKLHFAICGNSGSGKSSLINAFRGLANFDPGAAPTGVIETTTSITRYPDPHNELPHSRFIWFDIPGAGTLNVPGWQYFNEQGLFIFDIIILVYDVVSIL